MVVGIIIRVCFIICFISRKVTLVSRIPSYIHGNVFYLRISATRSVTAGVGCGGEGEGPYSRGQGFCAPSSKAEGNVRNNQSRCSTLLMLKGSGPDQGRTLGALPAHALPAGFYFPL